MKALRWMGLSIVMSLAVACGGVQDVDAVGAPVQVAHRADAAHSSCGRGTNTNAQAASAACCAQQGNGGAAPLSSCISDWCKTQCEEDCRNDVWPAYCYDNCYGSCRNAITACFCDVRADDPVEFPGGEAH